ncbi:MAG: SufS family cysteine desulfurase [Proteobacteria bacterium]|jgi:cysteine desulfurase/selenocysteine lyase|nr:SufS family cysteine desulfurase [Pseudomonadota bacterium]
MSFKSDFPILKNKIRDYPITYLDSAASTQKPQAVINSITEFYQNSYENVHRGMNTLSIKATDTFERARENVRSFINANSTNEVIFTAGATDSINKIAQCLPQLLNEGDKIVITELEHHSNYLPWLQIAKKFQFDIEIVGVNENGNINEQDIVNACDDSTKFLALTHMSNVTGQIIDIKKIKENISKDILIAVDGCQSIAHINIDVQDLDCDFYSFSSHKLYGPSGIGVMFGKEILLEKLEPPSLGGGMINNVSLDGFTYAMLPNKFEAGTPPIEAVAGMNAAIEYLNRLNFSHYFEEEKKLRLTLINHFQNMDEIEFYGFHQDINASSIVSFNVKNKNYNDISTFLDQFGIMIRGGHHCCQPFMKKLQIPGSCRVSFGIYNDLNDIDLLVDALSKTIKLLQ